MGNKNFSSPDNSNYDAYESTAFVPSSPHYSPDSEAPSDVRSNYTSETEEYMQTTASNDIDTMVSTKDDLPSDEPMSKHTHLRRKYEQFNAYTWEHSLNHPVDFPTKRHKAFHNSHFSIPEMI